jgi:hypothetical protein
MCLRVCKSIHFWRHTWFHTLPRSGFLGRLPPVVVLGGGGCKGPMRKGDRATTEILRRVASFVGGNTILLLCVALDLEISFTASSCFPSWTVQSSSPVWVSERWKAMNILNWTELEITRYNIMNPTCLYFWCKRIFRYDSVRKLLDTPSYSCTFIFSRRLCDSFMIDMQTLYGSMR